MQLDQPVRKTYVRDSRPDSAAKKAKRTKKISGGCDACGARLAHNVLVCCVHVPAVRHPWCAWCGNDVNGTFFCGRRCAKDYADDRIANMRKPCSPPP